MLTIAAMAVFARRTGVMSPVVMLLAGIALAFAPGVPDVAINPELVLLTLLPPILYASGVGMSWRGFRNNLRPILLLAIGCVVFTAGAVAALMHALFAWPLAVGFLLGAIVSPPDSVAPAAVLREMPIPRRIKTVLEGESLINDATALVAFSFALAAVASGRFSFPAAALSFAAIVTSETAYGLVVGFVALRLRHWSGDPRVEVLLALLTPYLAFWPPHEFGGSGVVACVTAGLWVSWNGRRQIGPATRLQGYFIWDLVTWLVESFAFLLTGLQAKALTRALAGSGWYEALLVSLVTCIAIVIVRFVWVFPATYLPRLLPVVRRRDPHPNWRLPFFVASAGIRGVVSMIAALSIPLTLDGAPFPYRDQILVATFTTIVFTMLGLGPAIRSIARWLALPQLGATEAARDAEDERRVRADGIDAVLRTLDDEASQGCTQGEVAALRRRQQDRRDAMERPESVEGQCSRPAGELQLQLLEVERRVIGQAYAENRLTDPARRRIEREFDLEQARIEHAMQSTGSAH